MANGITIGGANYRMGEVFANIANQQQQMAIQQQAQHDQLAMERMRMAQAQRNADADQQFRYASLEQQAQEAERGRQFTAERDQFGADKQMTLEQMRIGAGREERQDARAFTKEQNALDRQQRAELQAASQKLEQERMALQERLQDKSLSQQERLFLASQMDRLNERAADMAFKDKQLAENIRQFNVSTEGKDLDRQIKEETLAGQRTYREGQQEILRQQRDPKIQYSKLAVEATAKAAQQVEAQVKSLQSQIKDELDINRRRSLQRQLDNLNSDYHGSVKRATDFYMRGIPVPQGVEDASSPLAEERVKDDPRSFDREKVFMPNALQRQRKVELSAEFGNAMNQNTPTWQKLGRVPLLGIPMLAARQIFGSSALDRNAELAKQKLYNDTISRGANDEQARAYVQEAVDEYNAKGGFR